MKAIDPDAGAPADSNDTPLPLGPIAPHRPLRPQRVDAVRAARLLSDPGWWLQELLAGQRLLVSRTGDDVAAVGYDGNVVVLPGMVRTAAGRTAHDWLMDGVLVGDVFVAFDLPRLGFMNFRTQRYRMRMTGLEILLERSTRHLRIADTVTDHTAKPAWLEQQRAQARSGFILKHFTGHSPCGCLAGPDRWLRCDFACD